MPEGLAKRMLDAYGGEELWRSSTAVHARVSIGGLLFRWKRGRKGKWPSVDVRCEIAQPRTRFDPITRDGRVAVLDGVSTRIESPQGDELERRADPRTGFPYGRRLLSWDTIEIGYFFGYAMWNYLTLPALLLRDDIEWREVDDVTLEAHFPRHLPTHSDVQRFHLDPETWRLRQHDYTATPFGGWAIAAHMISEHANFDGLTAPSKRRVKPRASMRGGPLPGPLLIWADIHEYRLV